MATTVLEFMVNTLGIGLLAKILQFKVIGSNQGHCITNVNPLLT